eukprot:8665674-Pyramimonas_sp.AAC.1
MARCDLLRALSHTASCITKWTKQQDVDLFSPRLLYQGNFPLSYVLVGRGSYGGCLVEAILRCGSGK